MRMHSISKIFVQRPWLRWVGSLLVCGAVIGIEPDVAAQVARRSRAPSSSDKKQAERLLAEGMALHDKGEVEGALRAFLASKKLYPEASNLVNAANCLAKLERYDEALELYEQVLVNFAAGLTDANKARLPEIMTRLGQKVGSVNILINVDEFTVLVDGRRRVELRSGGLLRLLGGSYSLKILHDRYKPFETTLQINPGAWMVRTIILEPLVTRLRVVTTSESIDFEVFVDGEPVGRTPWEGQVQPGPHIVRTEKNRFGSMPTPVELAEGESKVLRLASQPLGQPLHVLVDPRTAEIMLDGLVLATGLWSGRLPPGTYTITAAQPGYDSWNGLLTIAQGDDPFILQIKVERHPAQDNPPPVVQGTRPVRLWLSASAGFGWAPSLGSRAETGCPGACADHRGAFGFHGGVRGGYEFPSGLSLELEGGYVWLQASFDRSGIVRAEYRLHDELRVAGPFVSGGPSYRFPLGPRFALSAGLHVGVLFASSSDGLALSGDTNASSPIDGRGNPVNSFAGFLMPEIAALWQLASFRVGLGLRLGAFLGDGPPFTHSICSSTNQSSACTLDSPVIRGERAYGPFLLASPQLRVTYVFE